MTFTLNSSKARAVVDSMGGELVSYVYDDVEYVWQGDAEHWSGRSPVLFPVCCAAKDGKMAHGGVEYPMPRHGIARKREFFPVYVSKTKVVLEQRESEETLKMFPFCYLLKIEHSITDRGFTTRYIVKNIDKDEMTFCIGGHPGFNCPLTDEEGGFEDHSIYFADPTGAVISITKDGYMDPSLPKLELISAVGELPLRYSDYDNDAIIIENLPIKSVILASKISGKGIKFDFEGFDALGIWTPIGKKSPFICLEPWNGLPAGVDETTDAKSKKYAKTIAPGEEYSVSYSVELVR